MFWLLLVWLPILLPLHRILLCFWGIRVPCLFFLLGLTLFRLWWVVALLFQLYWNNVLEPHLHPIPDLFLLEGFWYRQSQVLLLGFANGWSCFMAFRLINQGFHLRFQVENLHRPLLWWCLSMLVPPLCGFHIGQWVLCAMLPLWPSFPLLHSSCSWVLLWVQFSWKKFLIKGLRFFVHRKNAKLRMNAARIMVVETSAF